MQRRGRYAPSPSGQLHIGNARTALIAWLQMRRAGGAFVLRMEDIDKPRCRPEYARFMMNDLAWLGIDWDEGPDVGGPYSPYTQSEREALYQDALERLIRDGWLYPCTCTRSQLQSIASAPHGLLSEGPIYLGTCRDRPHTEGESSIPHSLRFALPQQPVEFYDELMGTVRFNAGAGGDFIVKRSDGIIGYQLAVVVDDAAMGITDVLRGDDLLDSTPRQIYLFNALGLSIPRFAHIPLIYGTDGNRLSKRHGSITLQSLRSAGAVPERIVGYLAYWSGLIDRPEPVAAQELISGFDIARLARMPLTVSEQMLAALIG